MTNKLELKGKPFQVLGLDVLIDENCKPWVIEVNHNPALSIFFDEEASMVHRRYTDEDINMTDLYVKARVVGDAIKLAKKSNESVSTCEQFGSLKRIHPIQGDSSIYNGIVALR